MMAKLGMVLILCLATIASRASELALFDLPLHSASREHIRQTIVHAGGILESSSRDIDRFDAHSLRWPGIDRIEVIYLQNRFVMAQVQFKSDFQDDARLRNKIATAYGQPAGTQHFDAVTLGPGKYRWTFDHHMALVFAREFTGPLLLTYVNTVERVRLERAVNAREARSAKRQTPVTRLAQ